MRKKWTFPLCVLTPSLILIILGASSLTAPADGLYLNGIGARSMSMGGADVAYASDPLGAMGANPAGLAFISRPALNFGFVGGIAQGTFTKDGASAGNLHANVEGVPQAAFALPLGKLTLGFG